MRTIEQLLGEVRALRALAPEHRDTLAGCARNRVFEAGERIMREGDPADAFYVLREGARDWPAIEAWARTVAEQVGAREPAPAR